MRPFQERALTRRALALSLSKGAATLFAFAALAWSPAAALASDGAALYAEHCAACHGAEGKGVVGLAPPLVSGVLKRAGEGEALAYVPRVIIDGISGPIDVEGQSFMSAMPEVPGLTDAQVAAIANFALNRLNGLKVEIAAAQVAGWRAQPIDHAALRDLRKSFAP